MWHHTLRTQEVLQTMVRTRYSLFKYYDQIERLAALIAISVAKDHILYLGVRLGTTLFHSKLLRVKLVQLQRGKARFRTDSKSFQDRPCFTEYLLWSDAQPPTKNVSICIVQTLFFLNLFVSMIVWLHYKKIRRNFVMRFSLLLV